MLNWIVAVKLKERHDTNSADAHHQNCKVSKSFALACVQNCFVDVSQNPCRRPFTPTKGGVNHCLTTVTQLIHLGRMRAILPCEVMFMQGHSPTRTVFPNHISTKCLRELAGEGMFLGSLGSILWSLYLLGAFPADEDDGGFEVID